MTRQRKKDEEEAFLKRFFECRSELATQWRPGDEPPDFEIGADFQTSVEVTRLSHHDDLAHRAELRRFEGELKRILQSERIYGSFLLHYGSMRTALRNRAARAATIEKLLPVVRDWHRGERSGPLFRGHLRELGIDWIDECTMAPFDEPQIVFGQARWAVGQYEERIDSSIQRKVEALARYPNNRTYEERWLLLVSGVDFSEPQLERFQGSADPAWGFDRVFFLHWNDKQVSELARPAKPTT